jgi:hypothetical protein
MIIILVFVAGLFAIEAFGDTFGLWLSGFIPDHAIYIAGHGSAVLAALLSVGFALYAVFIRIQIWHLERHLAEINKAFEERQ